MVGCGRAGHYFWTFMMLIATPLFVALVATSAQSAVKNIETVYASERASRIETAPSSNVKLAETYKYELPKSQRTPEATPTPPAQAAPPPVYKAPPTGGGGTKYRQGTTRAVPRAVGGSCAACRNSCYVAFRVNSRSSQFVPCMRSCWAQLCRR